LELQSWPTPYILQPSSRFSTYSKALADLLRLRPQTMCLLEGAGEPFIEQLLQRTIDPVVDVGKDIVDLSDFL
jgi:hypothetical protein